MRKYFILIFSFFGFAFVSESETRVADTLIISNVPQMGMDESQNIVWHWENHFKREEVQQIKMWLRDVNLSVHQTLGKYPFQTHFYIHRSKKGDEPVPWAHTTRGKQQGVHFHVNMNYGLEDFLNDWTAQHEISHLSIPFVGNENSWFSEGYATFMQYQIMKRQGVYTENEIEEKYMNRLEGCKDSYQTQLTFPKAADSLRAVWNYPDMYWGGVSFFWTLDQSYQKQNGKRLSEVVTQYVACCRVDESNPLEICKAFDNLTNSKLATKLLHEYQTQPAYLIFEGM